MLLSVALPVAAQDGAGRTITVEGDAGSVSVSADINTAAARRANGTVSVIVTLAGEPAYTEFIAAGGRANRAAANTRANDRAAALRSEQANFIGAAQALGGRVTGSFQFLNNAVVVDIAPDRVLGLANVPGVVAIGPNRVYDRQHTTSMPLVRASDVWEGSYTGGSFTGEGVTVAIIDEGIDYTHAHFGGEQNYSANDRTVLGDVTWPPAALPSAMGDQLVIGGTDYVGDDYNAAGSGAQLTPVPDPDPAGCPFSHGTHVAGTVAGYGVTAAGDTFTGDLTDGDALFPSYPAPSLGAFRIGPGAAPRANLVSLRVFGCDGSTGTDVLLQSLEAAATETYLGEDVDVVNMSLGSAYGGTGPDDLLNGAQEALAEIGVVVVASAGNNGDFYLVHGAPSAAATTISVANIIDSGAVVDGQLSYVDPVTTNTVNIPAAKGAMYDGPDPLTAQIVISNDNVNTETGGSFTDGCSPLVEPSPDFYDGKWVIVDRGVCAFSIKVENVKLAGGAGAIIVNNVDTAPFGPGGTAGFDDALPTVMIRLSDGNVLKGLINAPNTITGTFDGSVGFGLTDAPFVPSATTSRGGVLRGNDERILKPNISAPGDTITSAGAGTDNVGYTIGGTSMSSPHIAGAAALLIDALGAPTDLAGANMIKQRLMNTATTDMFATSTIAAPYHSPQRIGAGFADFVAAINTDLVAYATDAPENVSLSFGYPRQITGQPLVVTKTITLSNLSGSAMTLNTAYSPRSDWGGAFVTVSPAVVTVPAGGTTTVNVTLTVVADSSGLNNGGDPLFSITNKTILHEESGYVTFTPTAGSQTPIRVAVYAAPHLTSVIEATDEIQLTSDTGTAQAVLSGTGYDYNDYFSLTSAYQLVAVDGEETGLFWDGDSSGTDDPDEELTDYGAADVAYVGTAVFNPSATVTTMNLGIAMHEEWTTPREIFIEAYVDVNNDATFDYVWYYSAAASDAFTVSFQPLLETAGLTFNQTINYAHGSAVDSMLLKNNVMSLPLVLKSPAFNNPNRPNYAGGPITVAIDTYQRDSDFTFPIDSVTATFDPMVTFQPSAANLVSNLYLSLNGSTIPFSYDVTGAAELPELLLLHHHNNDPATRAEVVSLTQITGDTFELLGPPNGALVRDTSAITAATWTELTGATSYTFTLTQLTSNTGARAAGDQIIVTGTAAADTDGITCAEGVCSLDLTGAAASLEDGLYTWTVVAGTAPNLVEATNNPFAFLVETDILELALNGSFETAGATNNTAANWSFTDGRRSSAGGAIDGTFYALVRPGSRVQQNLNLTRQPLLSYLTDADTLNLDFSVKQGNGPIANLRVFYTDGTRDRCVIPAVVDNPDPLIEWEDAGLTCDVTKPVSRVVIQFRNPITNTAPLLVDDVSLTADPSAGGPRTSGLVPLPAAPNTVGDDNY